MTTALNPALVEDQDAAPLPTEEPELLLLGNQLLAELADVMAERGANAAAEKLQHEAIAGLYRSLDEPLARRYARITATLEAVLGQLPLRGKKSRRLANGTIGTRSRARRVEVTDEAAVIAAVKEHAHPEQIEQIVKRVSTEKLSHAQLTAWVAEHGWQPLPGTEIREAEEKFYADPLPPAAIGGAR
jgi:hypothetical protein